MKKDISKRTFPKNSQFLFQRSAPGSKVPGKNNLELLTMVINLRALLWKSSVSFGDTHFHKISEN